jgi:hypothetical protein
MRVEAGFLESSIVIDWPAVLRLRDTVARHWYLLAEETIPVEEFTSIGNQVIAQCLRCYEPARGKFTTLLYAALRRGMMSVVRQEGAWARLMLPPRASRAAVTPAYEACVLLTEVRGWLRQHARPTEATYLCAAVLGDGCRQSARRYGVTPQAVTDRLRVLRARLRRWSSGERRTQGQRSC